MAGIPSLVQAQRLQAGNWVSAGKLLALPLQALALLRKQWETQERILAWILQSLPSLPLFGWKTKFSTIDFLLAAAPMGGSGATAGSMGLTIGTATGAAAVRSCPNNHAKDLLAIDGWDLDSSKLSTVNFVTSQELGQQLHCQEYP